MSIVIFKVHIKDRKIQFKDENYIFNLDKFEDQDVDLIIKKQTSSRSDKQNRYYWAYLKIIEDETGNDSNDLHEFLKRKILPPVFITVLGQEIKIPASTTKLDKFQFTEYINKIEILTGIPSPNPDDLYI